MVTQEHYQALAAKFDEARWGNGPGVSAEDLATVGLKDQKTFTTKDGRKLKVTESWEALCCFVYEALSDKPFPGSKARGRGFRSQQCGKHVVELLQQLADK